MTISEKLAGEEYYRLFLGGDTDAFEALVSLYRNGLTLFINGMVGNMDEAEELMIDAFAQLAINRRRFEGRSSLKTYLFAIGRNLARRYVKKRGKYVSLYDSASETTTPESEYLKMESEREVYEAIRSLKWEQGEVLFLLYYEGMSYAEAGQVLKKTVSQVSSLVYRAKTALKVKLENREFTYL